MVESAKQSTRREVERMACFLLGLVLVAGIVLFLMLGAWVRAAISLVLALNFLHVAMTGRWAHRRRCNAG